MNVMVVFIKFFVLLLFFFGLRMITLEKPQLPHSTVPFPALLRIPSRDTLAHLFPKNAQEIHERLEHYLNKSKQEVAALLAIPTSERTWDNTMRAYDQITALSDTAIMCQVLVDLELVSPDKEVRDAAHAGVLKIQETFIDLISLNIDVYHALKAYAHGNALHEALTDEQRYFLQETLADYKRHGLDLPEEKRAHVAMLLKEIAALELKFEENIAQDSSTITVSRDALHGLHQSFIETLKRTDDGLYVVGVDYPTYFAIMENCSVAATRKELYLAFSNRAYPDNEEILNQVIAQRDQLAKLLGFASYAHLDIDDAMAHHPERVQAFLADLATRATLKEEQERDLLRAHMPDDIVLGADNRFQPWDYAYVAQQYKKKYLTVDETQIAEYFPMDSAIAGMLSIYQEFFGIVFKEGAITGLWSDEVRLIEVYNDNNQLLGYLLLDLFPRPNKYSHACHNTTIPAVDLGDATIIPALSLVVANFTKPTHDKPALLHRERDVETFFHEFGHALHALLGRTTLGSCSGTHVKTDFVEMPSQMLEEWLWDGAMLKKISKHYITGQPLPDELIAKIQQLKHFDTGYTIKRQITLANVSLACYLPGEHKNMATLVHQLHTQYNRSTAYEPRAHFYTSFGHLMGYGAKYYGYLWSKVFALDLFACIKQEGLLNPVVGKRYIREVLAKGGSQDPNQLIKNFLGREPSIIPFLEDLGLTV